VQQTPSDRVLGGTTPGNMIYITYIANYTEYMIQYTTYTAQYYITYPILYCIYTTYNLVETICLQI